MTQMNPFQNIDYYIHRSKLFGSGFYLLEQKRSTQVVFSDINPPTSTALAEIERQRIIPTTAIVKNLG